MGDGDSSDNGDSGIGASDAADGISDSDSAANTEDGFAGLHSSEHGFSQAADSQAANVSSSPSGGYGLSSVVSTIASVVTAVAGIVSGNPVGVANGIASVVGIVSGSSSSGTSSSGTSSGTSSGGGGALDSTIANPIVKPQNIITSIAPTVPTVPSSPGQSKTMAGASTWQQIAPGQTQTPTGLLILAALGFGLITLAK